MKFQYRRINKNKEIKIEEPENDKMWIERKLYWNSIVEKNKNIKLNAINNNGKHN